MVLGIHGTITEYFLHWYTADLPPPAFPDPLFGGFELVPQAFPNMARCKLGPAAAPPFEQKEAFRVVVYYQGSCL